VNTSADGGGEVRELPVDVLADTIDVRGLVEQVRVDAEGGDRGGVPELAGDERDVHAFRCRQALHLPRSRQARERLNASLTGRVSGSMIAEDQSHIDVALFGHTVSSGGATRQAR
jgi:hypothetical protein